MAYKRVDEFIARVPKGAPVRVRAQHGRVASERCTLGGTVGNAIDEARLLGADWVVIEFETMQQGIADTRARRKLCPLVSRAIRGGVQ